MKLLCVMLCVIILLAQPSVAQEQHSMLSARFIYNVMHYIQWPSTQRKNITLCTLGYSTLTHSLIKLAALPNNKMIDVKPNIDPHQLSECNVVYISRQRQKHLPLLLEQSRNYTIVTISDIKDFTLKGGMFEYIIVRNRFILRGNKHAIEESGIVIEPIIMRLISYD